MVQSLMKTNPSLSITSPLRKEASVEMPMPLLSLSHYTTLPTKRKCLQCAAPIVAANPSQTMKGLFVILPNKKAWFHQSTSRAPKLMLKSMMTSKTPVFQSVPSFNNISPQTNYSVLSQDLHLQAKTRCLTIPWGTLTTK